MKAGAGAFAVLDHLQGQGLARAEVFLKQGRSRRAALEPGQFSLRHSQEEGWAVRAGDDRCSFALAGTGRPRPDQAWPEPDGYPLRLPEARPVPPWREPREVAAPLIGEREGRDLLEGVVKRLERERPGATLRHAVLEDGSSESQLLSSQGVEARWRQRLATLSLEAEYGGVMVRWVTAEREARALHPARLAQALADRLAVRSAGGEVDRDRAEMLLAPPLGARLLHLALPLFVGESGHRLALEWRDRAGRLATRGLEVVDDGRLPGGLLSAPVDGEGLPTGETILLQDGAARRPLGAEQEPAGSAPRPGCARRAGWRDLPAPGPSHLYARVADPRPVGDLVLGVSRGYYLLDATGESRLDLESGRFGMGVYGFALTDGKVAAPVSQAWLVGSLGGWLRGIQGGGRDLTFFPLDGMIGSPTLLVGGLELRAEA